MRRWLCALLALAMLAPAALCEEAAFSDVAGTYELSSGVGAWFTEMTVDPDGSFSGYFQDTDMDEGELEGTPYRATISGAAFSGTLSKAERVGDRELDCTVKALTWEQFDPYVEDDALRVSAQPSGMNKGDRLRFFMEGAEAGALPEGFLVWVRMREGDIAWEALHCIGMYNETADAGFSGVERAPEVWLPEQSEGAPAAAQTWRFLEDEEAATEAPRPQPTPVSPAEQPEGDAAEGIEYPVQAEVVNCKTGVSLRAQPTTKAALLAEAPLGALVTVYSNQAWLGKDRWFVEASYNGQRGYICVEYLDILLPEDLIYQREYLKGLEGTVSAVNRGTDLILRAGPGTGYESLGMLFGGEVLGYKGEAKRDDSGTCWYRCSHYGEDCWISAKFTALTLNDGRSFTGSKGIF